MKLKHFESLKLRKDIHFLNANGTFLKSFSFHLKFLEHTENKVIFIVKKKIGKAPIRNKIKRQLRDIIANQSFFKNIHIHLMIIIKASFKITEFNQTKKELEKCLEKIEKQIQLTKILL